MVKGTKIATIKSVEFAQMLQTLTDLENGQFNSIEMYADVIFIEMQGNKVSISNELIVINCGADSSRNITFAEFTQPQNTLDTDKIAYYAANLRRDIEAMKVLPYCKA